MAGVRWTKTGSVANREKYIERDRKMKSITVLLSLFLICLSAGCAKYYYQEDKSFAECSSDRSDCMSELKKRLGTESQIPGSYEHKFMENCMKEKGYRLVTENELPLDAKRFDPDRQLRGYLYGTRRGIAGSLDEE
jgi:hypothetical protein